MSDQTVLVFAAHPDDELLGVGGTIDRHRAQGDYVTVVIVFECRTVPPDDSTIWWKLRRGSDPKEAVEVAVQGLDPDIVYTHHGGDINADHRALHEAVMVACRPYAAPSVKSIRTFHTPSSTEWGHGFTPTLYVDISDHIDAKLAAMALYESELRPEPHPRSLEYLKAQAMTWGAASGFRFAEAFQVERERW
jgi:LmbE family N-acetylglucosaminyl deacetylase